MTMMHALQTPLLIAIQRLMVNALNVKADTLNKAVVALHLAVPDIANLKTSATAFNIPLPKLRRY